MPLRYAGWMARDMVTGPGLIMLAVAGLVAFGMSRMPAGVFDLEAKRLLVRGVLHQSLLPLILVATGRIVSGDLSDGYYRSYFARPVSPPLFYLQRWLIGGAAIMLYLPVIALAVSIRTGSVALDPTYVGRAALLYLLVGGTVFLLSTVTRRDWAGAGLLYVLQSVLHMLHTQVKPLGGLGRVVHDLLPPFHVASLTRPEPTTGELWHALLYGLALVLAAMAVLRWRPLGSGGRA